VFSTGAYPARPDRFGVYKSFTPPGDPQQLPPEVLCLLVADGGFGSQEFLIVGGKRFDRAVSTTGGSVVVGNLALFGTGYGSPVANMPRVSGEVRALAVSNELFSNWGTGGYSRTILFGGSFEWVFYPKMGASVSETRMNLNSTNFSGELKYGKSTSALSHSPVHALHVESGNKLWVGRDKQHMGYSYDPLSIYTVTSGDFVRNATFASGLNSAVRGLAPGDNQMLVTGDFTQRTVGASSIPVGRALVFSTQTLGVVSSFRSSVDQPIVCVASARDAQNRLRGFILGGSFTKLIALRGNLAAMNAAGELLPWGPSVDGPVHAMALDGGTVFFGGEFTQVFGNQINARRSLACATANDEAVDAANWIADLSGSACEVRALAIDGSALVIGGDFTAVNGALREDAAAVDKTNAAVTPWNPDLAHDAASKVYALMLDGNNLYIGGSFSGTTSVARPGLLAVAKPSFGPISLLAWDAAIASPCTVRAIGASAADIFFVGQFATVGAQARNGAAAVTKSNAAPTSFAPMINGNAHALAVLPSGAAYIGGDFSTVSGQTRKGVAALDAAGNLLTWDASVLGTASGESVRALALVDTAQASQLWLAGKFTGTPHVGQRHLTWFSRAWSITTPTLPNANEDKPYGPVTVGLSEPTACTWSIHAPAAPWLQILASGAIEGNCPLGAPALIPVRITATQTANPSISADRWYMLAVSPKPPPTLISINGPASVIEGDDPILEPAPVVTIALNQLFGADVEIEIQYIDVSAANGRDYAAVVRHAKINAGYWTVDVPLCIFGDTITGAPTREFIVRIVSQTANVSADPASDQLSVAIQDDDAAQSAHAIVHSLHVCESATTPADPAHVVSNQPLFKWSFRSDFSGDAQTGWQVQVYDNSTFTGTAIWDSGAQIGTETEILLGAIGGAATLIDGQNYFARARLWSSPTEVSAWRTLAFHTNTPPPAVLHSSLTPSGNVFTSRPTLTWDIAPDAESDSLNFTVTLTGPSNVELDSVLQPWIFERLNATTSGWEPFGQAGVGAGYSKVRVTVPMGSALAAGNWNWTVVVNDGFESTAVATPTNVTINVQPAYAASGRVRDAALHPDAGRTVSVYHMPSHTLLGSNFTNANGDFIIPLGGTPQPGDVLAIVIDNPASPPPTYTPAYAAAFIRFSGNDLVQVSGPDRGIELIHGRVTIDPRGLDTLTLASLLDGSGGDPDWPFAVNGTQLVLRDEMSGIDIEGALAVLGISAAPGEPTALSLPGTVQAQQIKTVNGGALLIQDGASVSATSLVNDGCVSIETGGEMRLRAPSTTSGQFVMQQGSLLELNLAQLTITAGYPQWQSANVHGINGSEIVVVQGGALSASGTTFNGVTLDIGASGDVTDLVGAVFTGPALDHRIGWSRQRAIGTSLRSIRFDAGATYNVAATTGADTLTLYGCGGDLAGEASDADPGEATSQDIVLWVLSSLQECRAIAGDTRVLLLWNAGAQGGTGFTYNIYTTPTPGGQVTQIGTTQNSYYVDSGLTNGTARYYYIELSAWGTHSTWSAMLECTPQPPALEEAYPIALRQSGTAPGIAEGSATHFKSSTSITSPQTGITIPAGSIDIISETLILFEVETNAAALGQATIEITTPDVWIEHGYTGYSETVPFQAEVKPPATPNYPSVVFVQTGGAVGPDALTDGAFTVAVEFNKEGGADIEPQSFECVVNRDIMVGGQIVAAGTNLAGSQNGLWGTPTATGATWLVDQIQVTNDPQEEFISRGELIISVRISNAFGFMTPWNPMRLHVEGGDPDYAITEGTLEPGKANQLLTIRAGCLQNTSYELAFPQGSGISVQSVTTNSSSGIALEVIVNAATESPIGSDTYNVVQASTQQIVATGTYRTAYKYANLYSAAGSGAGPRAVTAAVGVILKTGEFTWSGTDLVTKARKFPIVWSRTYRSGRSERRDTPLGKGWYSPYFQKVEVHGNWSSPGLRWQTANGDFVDFDNPLPSGNKWVWRCPPGYNVLATTDSIVNADECDITATEGVTYRFSEGSQQFNTLLLREIVDSNLNRQVLEYDHDDKRPTVIRGDTYDFTGSTPKHGVAECLRLTYYERGAELLKTVTRVRSVKDQNDSDPLDTVRYYYTNGERLALQRMPDGDRFNERSYRGYWYEQGRLRKLFAPSRTVTDPAQIDPPADDSDHEWNCVAVGDGTSAPTTVLTVTYEQSGRVESQVLGPSGGSSERRYTIAYGSGSAPNERTVTPPSGSASDVKYVLNDDGQATSLTQYAPAVTGPGSSVFMTTFEYEAYTQNLLKVTQPAGNCTYFSYAHGPKVVGRGGAFENIDGATAGATTSMSVPNKTISANEVGCFVKLKGNSGAGDRERYYIVAQGTDDDTLVVGANLLNDGWKDGDDGTFEVYSVNTNPLSRSIVIQERRCEGVAWAPTDLIMTYVRKDDLRNGLYYSNWTETIDPWGRRTTTKRSFSYWYEALPDRSGESVLTTSSVQKAKNAVDDTSPTECDLSYVSYDLFGRLETVSGASYPPKHDDDPMTGSSTYYLYNAVGRSITPDAAKYPGQLGGVRSYRTGSHTQSPQETLTTYAYDTRGNVFKVSSPRGVDPPPFVAAEFDSTIQTNNAGQVIHVTGPASGPAGSCKTSETWYFYDEDGQLVRQCVKFVPVGQSDPAAGDGSEQTDAEIIAAFPRPQLIGSGNDKSIGKGWIHTRFEYNNWGDMIREIQDFDYDPTGQLVVAQTDYEYDLEGRQTVVNDPRGRITRSQHEPRGLRSVTFASGTAEQSAVEYRYDNNGNLNWEMIGSAPGTTFPMNMHEYDGFNRRKQTTHFHGAGGTWSEFFEYPKPTGPLETGSYLAIGAGSNLAKVRGSKSLEDGAGRVYRNWTIAQNKSGGALDGAVKEGSLHWAVSASELDARGMPTHSWVRLGEGWMPLVAHNKFDGRGTLIKAFGPSTSVDGEHTKYFYDAAGNTVKTDTPVVGPNQLIASSISEVIYDPCDRPWKTTLRWQESHQTSPDTVSTTTIERNNLGWPERIVDGAGRESRTDYNFAGLPRRSVVVENTGTKSVTEREYYKDGTQSKETAYRSESGSVFGGTKQETTYEYDAKRRVVQIKRPGNMQWTYTYHLTDQVKTETRPDGTVVTNDYDLVGNLTERTIVSPAGNSRETYTYGPFDEVAEAKTSNGGQLTSKLEMEYNSLGQVERQVLTVYDDQGNALNPVFSKHQWSSGQLGFQSLYEQPSQGSATVAYSSFEMTSDHDCLGREVRQGFWDGRRLSSVWDDVLPFGVFDVTIVENVIPLYSYETQDEKFMLGRQTNWRFGLELLHVRSMRPSQSGRLIGAASSVTKAKTRFAFGPQGGLVDVVHSHAKYNPGSEATPEHFAQVQTRYDGAGNPVLERSVHRGGLSRVAKYDHSTRLEKSFQGHLIFNTPGLILASTDSNLNPTAAQWERTYTQDTLDNITGLSDVIGADVASRTTTAVSMPVKSNTENVIKSIGSSGDFDYDNCKSLETDPTTGLTYKYNYRGQLESVTSGSTVIRRCVYDCFGRMVLQLEAPGGALERGTIFVPNVGFGGGGEGADYAAEITFDREGGGLRGREVVQYTYGIGAIGGGLGRKRLVEFVAFCDEFAPYYRFLHEDTQGNTIATTSLWGDRLDEYDYTDYGVPLHAPVALDGRWIAGIASGATDVSIVTLSESDMLVPNELIGCELRVALEEAGAAKQVFLAGTVISHLGAEVKIHDPGHKIATAWNQTAQGQVHKPSACFYDMREGCYRGVIDSATPGTWLGLPVTFITVGNGAFESWMISSYIQLGSQSAQILMADTPAQAAYPANGFKRLIVQGTGYSGAASGEWYTVIGNCATEDIARCGSWSSPAGCTGSLTTFVLSPHAEVRDEQVGWWLQPDINCQAWFPIVAASESNHTVTIAGDHRALGTVGTRFRIYAPPGVATRGAQAGTLPKFAEAASSRCLYKGYRYETAAAGRWTSQGIAARQGGKNFTGQHYTLFRHFDPSLMRFTSLDPIAASQNLWAYCDNNPHGSYDPDGLLIEMGPGRGLFDLFPFDIDPETMALVFQFGDQGLSNMPGAFGSAYDRLKGAMNHGVEGAFWGDAAVNQYEAVWQRTGRAEQGFMDRQFTIGAYMFGNQVGVIKGADAAEGQDTFTGEKLSGTQRALYGVAATGQFVGACLIVTGFADMQFNSLVNTPYVRTCGPIVRPTVPAPRMLRGTAKPASIESLRAMRAQAPQELTGNNISGSITNRGYWRKASLQQAWEGAVPGPTNGRLCPTCGTEVHASPQSGLPRDWDMSHTPSWTKRRFPQFVTRKQVLDNYQQGTWLECPHCNRAAGNRR
jgi:RHS repeat-associated protein